MISIFSSARPWPNAGDSDLQRYEAISRVFMSLEYLLPFFFDTEQPRVRLAPEKMLRQADGMSTGEFLLIKIALDIWSGSGNARVWELIENLDQQNFSFVLQALLISRQNRV